MNHGTRNYPNNRRMAASVAGLAGLAMLGAQPPLPPAGNAVPEGSFLIQVLVTPNPDDTQAPDIKIHSTVSPHTTLAALVLAQQLMLPHVTDKPQEPQPEPSRIIAATTMPSRFS